MVLPSTRPGPPCSARCRPTARSHMCPLALPQPSARPPRPSPPSPPPRRAPLFTFGLGRRPFSLPSTNAPFPTPPPIPPLLLALLLARAPTPDSSAEAAVSLGDACSARPRRKWSAPEANRALLGTQPTRRVPSPGEAGVPALVGQRWGPSQLALETAATVATPHCPRALLWPASGGTLAWRHGSGWCQSGDSGWLHAQPPAEGDVLAFPAPAEVVHQLHSRRRLRAGTRGAERKRRRPATATSALTASTTIDGATSGHQEPPRVGCKEPRLPVVVAKERTAATAAATWIALHFVEPPLPVASAEFAMSKAAAFCPHLALPTRALAPRCRHLALHSLSPLPRRASGHLLPPIILASTATRPDALLSSPRLAPGLCSVAHAATATKMLQRTR